VAAQKRKGTLFIELYAKKIPDDSCPSSRIFPIECIKFRDLFSSKEFQLTMGNVSSLRITQIV
jgi:hypothetical protein